MLDKTYDDNYVKMPEINFSRPSPFKRITSSSLRLLFILAVTVSLLTVVGALVLAPLFSYWFYGTFKFWKHISKAPALLLYGYRLVLVNLKGEANILVPLAAAPMKEPDRSQLMINPEWKHGESCGHCTQCCELLPCPLLDKKNKVCRGYNSFYWNYFNCGRYPIDQHDIERYSCPKWRVKAA